MSQTVRMRRRSGAGAITILLALAAFTALASLIGVVPARASSMAGQVFPTRTTASTAPTPSTSIATSTIASTTPQPVSTTAAVPTTRPRVTATTAPARVMPPSYTAPRYQSPTSLPPTTPASTTTTTILGIGGHLPVAPVTLPLHTKSSNGHVNPAFAWLSAIGFGIALLIVGSRLYATRPRGRDRAPIA